MLVFQKGKGWVEEPVGILARNRYGESVYFVSRKPEIGERYISNDGEWFNSAYTPEQWAANCADSFAAFILSDYSIRSELTDMPRGYYLTLVPVC